MSFLSHSVLFSRMGFLFEMEYWKMLLATRSNMAQVLQRILVEQCSAQTKAVIQAEGIQAVGESFQQVGQITGEEIVKNTEVKQQLNGSLRYVDSNKMVTTFLTPEIWNKLGVVR